ncbi:MAG TPA: hypothetical protein VEW42_01645 [Candidatus Eisenbacteria bacterium]|nr:hypothetical protein [Candidatus Eisenbacteria bacterium]
MRGRLQEYIPHPFAFGIEGRTKLPIVQELKTVRKRDSAVIVTAKEGVATLIRDFPDIPVTQEEVAAIRPQNIHGLYAKPSKGLIYSSPHNIRHFAATDLLSLFIGKYVNAQRAINGESPLDITALRYGAWTHDSYRSRFDILGTILNYQLHGIRASENLNDVVERGGLQLPPHTTTVEKIKEIDRFHDVDNRPLKDRSREIELFTTIDKLEMVRLFRPSQLHYKMPIIAQGIHMLAKKRMKAHEGGTPELMTIMGKFLPIVDGLYRLTMQDINAQRRAGIPWEKIDQYAAVQRAGKELGIIQDK